MTVKKRDGRKEDRQTLAFIRRNAVERVRAGESVTAVMDSYGQCRTTYYKWERRMKQGDGTLRALAARKSPGAKAKLTDQRKAQVRRWVVGKDPRQYGFDFGLWTRALVGALILEKLGISLKLTAVGRLLAELEITPQKPLARAYKRDPKAVARWKQEEFPALQKKARRTGAVILFLDETGMRADQPLGRTWGRKGHTPVVRNTGSRARVSVIGAVSAKGAFWHETYKGKFTGPGFVEHLKALRRGRGRIILVLDSHPVHVSRVVADYVAGTQGALELAFLPGYAPDLNPSEGAWRYAKRTGTSRTPLREGENFHARVEADMQAIKGRRRLVRSFFDKDETRYILNAA